MALSTLLQSQNILATALSSMKDVALKGNVETARHGIDGQLYRF